MLKSKGLLLLAGGLLFGSIMGGVIFLTGSINAAATQTSNYTTLKAGNPMPDFELTSLDNSDIHINQYLGKPVIVKFLGQLVCSLQTGNAPS